MDDDRTVRGFADPLDTEARLVNIISDSLNPRLVPEIDVIPWRSTHLIIVTVHLSSARPHRLIADGEVAYVRPGSSNRQADDELTEEMRRSTLFESFDEAPFPAFR